MVSNGIELSLRWHCSHFIEPARASARNIIRKIPCICCTRTCSVLGIQPESDTISTFVELCLLRLRKSYSFDFTAAKLSWQCCGINVILDLDCHTETSNGENPLSGVRGHTKLSSSWLLICYGIEFNKFSEHGILVKNIFSPELDLDHWKVKCL